MLVLSDVGMDSLVEGMDLRVASSRGKTVRDPSPVYEPIEFLNNDNSEQL